MSRESKELAEMVDAYLQLDDIVLPPEPVLTLLLAAGKIPDKHMGKVATLRAAEKAQREN